jgi:hypothetical protein
VGFLDHRHVIGPVPYDMAKICMYVCYVSTRSLCGCL